MRERIWVINPNSTVAVTCAIDEAMAPLRLPGGPEILCLTLEEGPPGVESQLDADGVILPMCRMIREHDADAAAYVIACFSDPGLFSARESTTKPVLGIAECGIVTALTLGHRFGVISILARSVARHLRYIGAMGVTQRLAADLPAGGSRGHRTRRPPHRLGADDRGRPHTARPARRRRAGDGVRRYGALPRRSRGGGADTGGRADPGRGHDGDRPCAARLA